MAELLFIIFILLERLYYFNVVYVKIEVFDIGCIVKCVVKINKVSF